MGFATVVKGGSKWLKLGNLLWLQVHVDILDPSQHLYFCDLCGFTAFEIKCSSKWQKTRRLLESALPMETPERCVSLPPRWISLHAPFHKVNKTLILEPRRTLSSKQLTWVPGSKYTYVYLSRKSLLFCRPSAEPLPLRWKDYHVIIH